MDDKDNSSYPQRRRKDERYDPDELLKRKKELQEKISRLSRQMTSQGASTLVHLLPLVLNLEDQPYSLKEHFPFECLFSTWMPPKIVLKTGRQVSKTHRIASDQRVYLANGRPVRGETLRIGDQVLSVDDHRRSTVGLVIDTIQQPDKQTLRVTTRMGSVLDIAITHPLQKLTGWTVGDELSIGDRIATLRQGGVFQNKPVEQARIVLTAYLIGDGCVRSGNLDVSTTCPSIREECLRYGTQLQSYPVRATSTVVHFSQAPDSPLVQWLKEDGLWQKYSYEKSLPPWVFSLGFADTCLFLSRLWATDGQIKTNSSGYPSICYSSTSRPLAFDVKALLTKLGIPSSIRKCKAGYVHKPSGEYKPCRDAYVVRVETRQGWLTFLASLDVPGKPRMAIPETEENNNRHTVPIEVSDWIEEIVASAPLRKGETLHSAGLRKSPKYPLSYPKLNEYVRYFKEHRPGHPRLQDLEDLASGDIIWDEIVSIEETGLHPCWDIEVESKHNYVVDGVLSHNSTSIAAHGIITSASIRRFKTLYVTPLYEQIRRFSTNYVQDIINQSPIKPLLVNTSTNKSVLQRSFANESIMHFSYALLSADRTRGIRADKVAYDEAQDLDRSHIPIIDETMSHSKYSLRQFTGTPKTRDNTLENLWQRSSMAEWFIKCMACNQYNIPTVEWHLLKMIGPYSTDISPTKPATICAHCGKRIDPRNGFWMHKHKDRRQHFAGYHVPQVIMPIHYTSPSKWAELLGKMNGVGGITRATFWNEVLGESCDESTRMVSKTDLEKAGILNRNIEEEALKACGYYQHRVLGVDWGGGGEDGVSLTAIAVLGMLPNGRIDVIFGKKLVTTHDHVAEALECIRLFNTFQCEILAHDYTGAGNIRETVMVQMCGLSSERLMPISLVRAATHGILTFVPATIQHPRNTWRLDKARSLQLTSYCIKLGKVLFFTYDYIDDDQPGLLHDFLALVENKVVTHHGSDIYTIQKDPSASDDFAQAVNLGCCALWHMTDSWPRFLDPRYLLDANASEALGSFDNASWDNEMLGVPGYRSEY